MTQTALLWQRLVRGTPLTVANSFGKAELRGSKLIIASKGPVKCNGKGRCAGDWCIGLALFLMEPDTNNDAKKMGWRTDTVKICLTHLKDEEGNLILPPPALRVAQEALSPRAEPTGTGPVSWEELAQAVAEKDWSLLTLIARRLKRENETLRQTVIETQGKLIGHLQPG